MNCRIETGCERLAVNKEMVPCALSGAEWSQDYNAVDHLLEE